EVAALRGRPDGGVAIRNRVLDATQTRVDFRAKEKRLRARPFDSGKGRDCVVGSAEGLQGARQVESRLGGAEVRGLSKGDLRIRGPARREERAAHREPSAGIRR